MHYYQFNIGDYASHTRHLEPLEDLTYRRLLDLYYLHERPLNADATTVAKQIGLRDHAAIVRDVLNEFFEKTEAGYCSARADREIAQYRAKIEQASRAGKASAERRINARSTDGSTDEQLNNNQEPITNNQKPNKKKKAAAAAVSAPQGMDAKVWEDWLAIRRAKSLPLTETAWEQMVAEAGKAGLPMETVIRECCLRGWGAFKASWWEREKSLKNQGDRNADVLRGLTRGLVGGTSNVKLLGE